MISSLTVRFSTGDGAIDVKRLAKTQSLCKLEREIVIAIDADDSRTVARSVLLAETKLWIDYVITTISLRLAAIRRRKMSEYDSNSLVKNCF
jgi:hypothetical protein